LTDTILKSFPDTSIYPGEYNFFLFFNAKTDGLDSGIQLIMMAENLLQQQIEAYDHWKSQLIDAIKEFQEWLDRQNLDEEGKNALRIYEAIEALNKDRLNIAFVAEFSRGKTELINAIFFADHGRRLLPSEAGRTTMCPTELFYDHKADAAYIRLLPIGTRIEEQSIAEFKQNLDEWTLIPLEIDQPEQMEEAMREVVSTKTVSVEQATKLGLYSEEMYPQNEGEAPPEEIEIPKWRHALISFPHPLLKQGLTILDTPGLNAMGNEPELTMSMLPAAQAVIFVLAADTGVTRSDMDMWKYHINGASRTNDDMGVAIVLNKIDTLWDELKEDHVIDTSIGSQIRDTSTQLGVNSERIFPLSAHKGLLAKIRDDDHLLKKSGLPELEDYLCNEVVPSRETILRDNIVSSLGHLLENNQTILASRLENTIRQLSELRSLSGKNADVILHLMRKTREEQTSYMKNVESFQASQRVLKRQAQTIKEVIDLDELDKLINRTRKEMMGSWTTAGLRGGMKGFFEGLQINMEELSENAEQVRRLVMAIYKKFHTEHGLPAITPSIFSVTEYVREINELYEDAELFRKSPVTAMTEQTHVVKNFFIHLVSRARNVFFKANQEADAWLNEVMSPLVTQIKEHKQMMEKRLKTLRKINESRDTLDSKVSELEKEDSSLKHELEILKGIHARLSQPIPYQGSSAA
jgi:hypothetical protein